MQALKLDVSSDLLRQYTQALKLIADLNNEQVRSKAPGARSTLESYQRSIASAQQVLTGMQQQLEKEAKDVQKVSGGWYAGKIIKGKGKHEARVQKEVAEHEQAQQEVDAQHAYLAQLQQSAAAAADALQELEDKVSQLAGAQAFEAHVVESLFSGAAGDDFENKLEAAVIALKPQLDEATSNKTTYTKGDALLVSATRHLQQAEQGLEQALRLAGGDVVQDFLRPGPFRNSAGGVMIDVAKRRHMEMGAQMLAQSAEEMAQAKALLPDMPYIDMSKVRAFMQPGIIMDMLFDNIVTDMRVRQQISAQLQDVKALGGDLSHARGWVTYKASEVASKWAALDGEWRMKKGQLDAHRRQLLEQLLAASAP